MANNLRLSPYYWKYDGVQVDGELRLPISNTSSAPSLGLGSTRWNPTNGTSEIWNGTEWSTFKASNGGITVLKDLYEDVSNSSDTVSTPLYRFDIPGNTLVSNGQKLIAKFSGSFLNNSLKTLNAWVNGISIFSYTSASAIKWNMEILIIRTETDIAKVSVINAPSGTARYNLTDQNFAAPITLAVGGYATAIGEITAEMGTIYLLSSAQ